MSKDLQTQFNLEHATPVPFGEDGDYYGLSYDLTDDQAIERFNTYWEECNGEDEPKPDTAVHYAYFQKVADGWKLDLSAGHGDAKGLVVQII